MEDQQESRVMFTFLSFWTGALCSGICADEQAIPNELDRLTSAKLSYACILVFHSLLLIWSCVWLITSQKPIRSWRQHVLSRIQQIFTCNAHKISTDIACTETFCQAPRPQVKYRLVKGPCFIHSWAYGEMHRSLKTKDIRLQRR